MAKQASIIKLKGTIGGISFYKSKDGYLAREKGGVEGTRIASDPAFQRTRENGAEFGRAGAAGKLLRTAFRALVQHSSDDRMASRLTSAMVKVIQADATSARGLRNVIDGEAELLKGFEFNANGKLSSTLFAPYDVTIDRALGQFSMDLAPFVPANMIAGPAGATHYKINAMAADIDFTAAGFQVKSAETGILPINNVLSANFPVDLTLTPDSTNPLFFALGIEFYQDVNGTKYVLKNGAFNAASLVQISGV